MDVLNTRNPISTSNRSFVTTFDFHPDFWRFMNLQYPSRNDWVASRIYPMTLPSWVQSLQIINCNYAYDSSPTLQLLFEMQLVINERDCGITIGSQICIGRYGMTSNYLDYGPTDAIRKVETGKFRNGVTVTEPFYLWDINGRTKLRELGPPSESIFTLFRYFAENDLRYLILKCMRICKWWNAIGHHDALWRDFYYRNCVTFDLSRGLKTHFNWTNSECTRSCFRHCEKQMLQDKLLLAKMNETPELQQSSYKRFLEDKIIGWDRFHTFQNEKNVIVDASAFNYKNGRSHLCATGVGCGLLDHFVEETVAVVANMDIGPVARHFFKSYVKRQAFARLYNIYHLDKPIKKSFWETVQRAPNGFLPCECAKLALKRNNILFPVSPGGIVSVGSKREREEVVKEVELILKQKNDVTGACTWEHAEEIVSGTPSKKHTTGYKHIAESRFLAGITGDELASLCPRCLDALRIKWNPELLIVPKTTAMPIYECWDANDQQLVTSMLADHELNTSAESPLKYFKPEAVFPPRAVGNKLEDPATKEMLALENCESSWEVESYGSYSDSD